MPVPSQPVTDLESLHTFQAVVRLGGISAAARELRLAKSTVSKHVARLEAGIGARLLLREARTVVPTPAGVLVTSRADQLLALLEDLRHCAAALGSDEAGAPARRRSTGVGPGRVPGRLEGAGPPLRPHITVRRATIPNDVGTEDQP